MTPVDVTLISEGAPWYETVAPYVVALLAIVGAAMSVRWTSLGGHRSWLLQQRLDVVAHLLESSHTFIKVAIRIWNMPQTSPERHPTLRSLQDLLTDLDYWRARLALLGPKELADVATSFVGCHTAVSDRVVSRGGQPSIDDLGQTREYNDLTGAYVEFHVTAQSLLRTVHPSIRSRLVAIRERLAARRQAA